MLNFVSTDVLDAQLCGHGMQFRAILYENINCKSEPSGFLPFTFKTGKEINTIIDQQIQSDYLEQLCLLINEILGRK